MSRSESGERAPPAIKQQSQDHDDGRNIRDVPPAIFPSPDEEQADTTQTLDRPESSADGIGSRSEQGNQDTIRRQMKREANQRITDAQDLTQMHEPRQQTSGTQDGSLAQEGLRREAEEEAAGVAPDSTATAAPQQPPQQLLFRSNQAAYAHQNRRRVGMPAYDDVDEVAAKNEQWVIRILDAYNEDYQREMEGLGKKQKFIKEYYQNKWDEWQTRALKEVKQQLNSDEGKNLREIRARALLEEVIKIHRDGNAAARKDLRVDQDIKCSERLERLIMTFDDLCRARVHLLSLTRPINVEFAATSPSNYRKDILNSFWSNYTRDSSRKRDSLAAERSNGDNDEDDNAQPSEGRTPAGASADTSAHLQQQQQQKEGDTQPTSPADRRKSKFNFNSRSKGPRFDQQHLLQSATERPGSQPRRTSSQVPPEFEADGQKFIDYTSSPAQVHGAQRQSQPPAFYQPTYNQPNQQRLNNLPPNYQLSNYQQPSRQQPSNQPPNRHRTSPQQPQDQQPNYREPGYRQRSSQSDYEQQVRQKQQQVYQQQQAYQQQAYQQQAYQQQVYQQQQAYHQQVYQRSNLLPPNYPQPNYLSTSSPHAIFPQTNYPPTNYSQPHYPQPDLTQPTYHRVWDPYNQSFCFQPVQIYEPMMPQYHQQGAGAFSQNPFSPVLAPQQMQPALPQPPQPLQAPQSYQFHSLGGLPALGRDGPGSSRQVPIELGDDEEEEEEEEEEDVGVQGRGRGW